VRINTQSVGRALTSGTRTIGCGDYPNMKYLHLAAALALACTVSAIAQDFPLKMTGGHGGLFKGRGRLAIPSYSINYIVAQKASAAGGVSVKARSTTILAGIDEALMRKVVDEAFEDLKAQMTAAGLPLASDAEAASVLSTSGTALAPGNTYRGGDGGIVIGKGIKKQFVSFGATAAPLTELFQPGGKIGGLGAIGKIGSTNKLNTPGEAIDATLIFPSLTLDFAESEVSVSRTLVGGKRASAKNEVQFSIRAESPVNIQNPAKRGIGTPGTMRPAKDASTDVEFSTVEGGTSATSQTNYGSLFDDGMIKNSSLVVADPAKWTELARAAYRSYNAAIVAAIKDARK
jgi:hypothetical protein